VSRIDEILVVNVDEAGKVFFKDGIQLKGPNVTLEV
jgi:hypothetical protein